MLFPQCVSHLNLFSVSLMCSITVSDLSVILSSLSSSVHVLFCLFIFFIGTSVSPCWQRGITAPGIGSSSQAFGWRSTSQMKRILVLLKVAAVPVDAFAVTLGVIYNPFFTRFLFIHVVFLPVL